ncbi:MAG: hypothetical protein VYC33_04050 [Candidatus Thermoplasmatota archaeon]|nr:hypothetical protein [Candidatus Thermoplasmatota archaeon]
MKGTRDSEWMRGQALWYPASESTPEHLVGEENPGENWDIASSSEVGRGWMRQRLQPLGPRILYTTAWAPFFFIASAIPLAFPGRTPDDQLVAISLFSASWFLLLLGFRKLQDGLPIPVEGLLKKFYPFDIVLMLPAAIFFLLHILIDSRFGWLSFLLFAFAQYRTIQNLISVAGENSARWLLPIIPEDYSEAVLNDGWMGVSTNFRNGTLARWEGALPEYTANLIGVTRGDSRFVAFTLMHRVGTIHDAFSDTFVSDPRFASLLSSPPLLIAGEAWSERFLGITD